MTSWETLAGLPLTVEGYTLDGLAAQVSSDFERRSTVVGLGGLGLTGRGEDVVYDAVDHEAMQAAGPVAPVAGRWTLGSFCDHVDGLDLFPVAPQRPVSRLYRRWTFHSAALDLALRQSGLSLHAALGRDPRPVHFVVSLRLGEPAAIGPVRDRLDRYPTLRFKLDPTPSWTDDLIAELVATGAVESVDLKGLYVGSVVDNPPDPDLYRRVAEAFPDAWIEDPMLTPETDAVLAPYRDRITWDEPIHGVADIEARPFPPRMVNIKPSRLGGLRSVLDAYDYCAERGIGNYGGGQFELGPGRGHIQYLASLFHPDSPNDVAPSGYNAVELDPDLPDSPLAPAPTPTGFRWDGGSPPPLAAG
jgi:L-alanine-DL-glutamate epimerase-like enolase superfamily enzyme